jgi:hypothetical protein
LDELRGEYGDVAMEMTGEWRECHNRSFICRRCYYYYPHHHHFEIPRHYTNNTEHVECNNRSDTGNNSGHWNHPKTTLTVTEQHTGKAGNQAASRQQPYWALHSAV